jgi:hypothetical protein
VTGVGRPFAISFESGAVARGVEVVEVAGLGAALAAVGLRGPTPVVVLVGGAGGLSASELERLRPLFAAGLAPALGGLGAVAVDGGTRSAPRSRWWGWRPAAP